jgi:RNA polymerase sigma-70 factor (ECF subfamily)
MVLLERLSPVERAVFLLRDVFDYGYGEIAEVLGRSEASCRQLAVRARRHVDERRPRFEASRRQREQLAERFFAAVGTGDVDSLVELLAADVVVSGDSGGRPPSWGGPIHGRERVTRLLTGLARQSAEMGVQVRRTEINGQPGALFLDAGGRVMNVFALDIAEGQVQAIRSIINPDKLRHLGPLADVRAMMHERIARRTR